MPADKRKMALKAGLLAPAGTILPWGVQKALSGEPVVGTAAIVIGTLFIVGFVAVQEYDLPYEDEIVSIIESQDPAETADAAQDVSERVGEAADDYTDDSESGR